MGYSDVITLILFGLLFVVGLASTLKAQSQIRSLGNQTDRWNPTQFPTDPEISSIVREAVNFSETDSAIEYVLDKACHTVETRLSTARTIGNLYVYIGLLGTLIGLTSAVGYFKDIPGMKTSDDVFRAGQQIGQALGGFRTAFTSAILGVLLTVIFVMVTQSLETKLENILDNLRKKYLEFTKTGVGASSSDPVARLLQPTIEAILGVQGQLSTLIDSIEQTNARQEAAAGEHAALVKQAGDNLTRIADAAIEGFATRLSDQVSMFAEIRDSVQAASLAAQNQLASLVEATKTVSSEIIAAIESANRQRVETDQNVYSLASAAEKISVSVDKLTPYLETGIGLEKAMRHTAEQLEGTVSNLNIASEKFEMAGTSLTDRLKEYVESQGKLFTDLGTAICEQSERQQEFYSDLAGAAIDLPTAIYDQRILAASSTELSGMIDAPVREAQMAAARIDSALTSLETKIQSLANIVSDSASKTSTLDQQKLFDRLDEIDRRIFTASRNNSAADAPSKKPIKWPWKRGNRDKS